MLEYTKQLFCWHLAAHVEALWPSLPFPIYLMIVCHIHRYCGCLKLYSSLSLALYYYEIDMCNLPLLLNSGCICPPPSVVTWVKKMKQNCGSLFLKVVLPINIILSSLSVSGCGIHVACSGVVPRCHLLSVWRFQYGGMWCSLDWCIDTSISEEFAAFIFRVVQEPSALPWKLRQQAYHKCWNLYIDTPLFMKL